MTQSKLRLSFCVLSQVDMIQSLLFVHSDPRINHKYSLDEVGQFRWKVLRDLVVEYLDLSLCLGSIERLERCVTCVELIGKDSDSPHIELCVIVLFVQNLGAEVVDGSTKSVSAFSRMYGPPEITELHIVVTTQNDVLWLEVSMNNVKWVKMLHGQNDLSNISGNLVLLEISFLFEYLVKLTSWSVLEYQIDPFLIEKEAKHL